MKRMKKQLVELLNIHAVSGNEKPVAEYVIPKLTKLMDAVYQDAYGNVLAEKKVGNGRGATILLSAHMDTVKGVLADRKLVFGEDTITSDKGALGADDRAGIAIIFAVLRNIKKLKFNGTIKVSFSREEEIGVVGAGKIDPKFYEDVDLAIVVDRRGNRDIVVGCGMAYCSDNVGNFMQEVGAMIDMDWKCIEGGISDAIVFAENGINAINLSAGYYGEHTDKEYVVISQMKDTVRLILQAFAIVNDFVHTFGDVPKSNKWVESWYYNYRDSKYNKYYQAGIEYAVDYSDSFVEDIYAESSDKNGDVFVYEIGADVVIQQGDNEILLSRESLRDLISQLKNV